MGKITISVDEATANLLHQQAETMSAAISPNWFAGIWSARPPKQSWGECWTKRMPAVLAKKRSRIFGPTPKKGIKLSTPDYRLSQDFERILHQSQDPLRHL